VRIEKREEEEEEEEKTLSGTDRYRFGFLLTGLVVNVSQTYSRFLCVRISIFQTHGQNLREFR
jgi:hypothetical protein